MDTIPSYQVFKEKLEELFGQKLNEEAMEASKDFWNNWNEFFAKLSDNSININVDMLFLTKYYPQYGRCTVWKAIGVLLFVIGVIMFFFSLKLGIVTFIISFLISYYGKMIKLKDAKRFVEQMKKDIEANEITGMAKICSHYIVGTVLLSSRHGFARWPSYPSAVLTGQKNFIE